MRATLRREPLAEPGEPAAAIVARQASSARSPGVEDGVNGLFVDRDPGDIAQRLRELHDDPELRISMGRARQGSLRFTWAGVVASYEAPYANMVG